MNINEILKCLNCGSCVKGCPQYLKYQKETKSPRGKIRNIKYCFEHGKKIDLKEFDDCINCDKCQNVCPAGIEFKKYFNKEALTEIFKSERK